MVPTDDQFRAHVVKLGDGRLMCGFCHQVFAATTSLWRFKWHWSGVEGHGVRPCLHVDLDAKEAASRAHQQPPSKKRKSLSNMIDGTSTPTRDQIKEVGNLVGDLGSMLLDQGVPVEQEGASSNAQAAGDSLDKILGMRPEEIEELLNGLPVIENMTGGMMRPTYTSFSFDISMAQALEQDAIQAIECQTVQNNPQLMKLDAENEIGGLVQPVTGMIAQALESTGDSPQGTEYQATRNNAQLIMVDAENGIGGLVQPVAGVASSSERLPCNKSPETIEDALTTRYTKLVGKAFEKNKNEIWSWLRNDGVSLIGIYGMGGVGKTSLMKCIYEELLGRSPTFGHVCWITVSQDFSISKLQNSIAKHIDLDLSNEDDELHKAIKLSNRLKKKQRWVLILDDLWNYFELDWVGIPFTMKRCKLILTSRSLWVCERMACQKMMKVKPLMWEEAWTLFMEKLERALSSEVEQIAKSIVRECDGLPLGIITMAGTMRAVTDICEWRNALEELKESTIRKDDMEPEVFRILRFSYNHLNDSALQQCFLFCALFPEDKRISREELIDYFIDEGIIEGMKSRQAEFDKGHTMLNKLEKVSLLENCQVDRLLFGSRGDDRAVKMHDLLRDMAIQIQQKNSQVMVKAGEQLTDLSDLEWKESLVRVSLMENQIETIPRSRSTRCPWLSTVLLQFNPQLRFIADSFFKKLHSLKVLDLSFTSIEILPDSISDLVVLSALLLKACLKLRCVPSLEKLKRLRRLDLASTVLVKMPQGMKRLSNLRYFSLGGCQEKSEFPIRILPRLSRLQVFIQGGQTGLITAEAEERYSPSWVKGKEIVCLKKLEILECHFEHLCDMEEYLKSRYETQTLSSYCIFVGWWDVRDYQDMRSSRCTSKTVGLGNLSISRDGDFQVMFPKDMKELMMCKCDVATSLPDDSSSIEYATELEVLDIQFCTRMESLLPSSWLASDLHEPLSSLSIFSSLKEFTCRVCRSMKKLFPLTLLPNLGNLECLTVDRCKKIEEIIARDVEEDEESSSSHSITEFSLPKLRILKLRWLLELGSICSAKVKLRCDSLEEICISDCPMLRRMPFSLPLLDDGQPSPSPTSIKSIKISSMDWWHSVNWDHPKAKNVLLPFVSLRSC